MPLPKITVNEAALGQIADLVGEQKERLVAFVNEKIKQADDAVDAAEKARKAAEDDKDVAEKARKQAEDDLAAAKKQAEDDQKANEEKVAAKILELNDRHAAELARAKGEFDEQARALGVKVNEWITNALPRLRQVVAEEIRLSPDGAGAAAVLESVRRIVGEAPEIPSTKVEGDEPGPAEDPEEKKRKQEADAEQKRKLGEIEAQCKELKEGVEDLNGRVARKDKIIAERDAQITKLNGMLKAWQLCADDPDRAFILKQLGECRSETEVDERFGDLKRKLRRDAEADLIEQLGDPQTPGPEGDPKDAGGSSAPTNEDSQPATPEVRRRWAELAGIR